MIFVALKKNCAFDGIDSEKLWGERYLKHWEKYRPNYYCLFKRAMVQLKCNPVDGELYKSDMTNHEKYFAILATTIFCAERPSGFFSEHDKFWEYDDVDVPSSAKFSYPNDIVNYLVAADELQKPGKQGRY